MPRPADASTIVLRAGAGIRACGLVILALAVVVLAGCRRAAPPAPAQGWVRLSALLPLHPNQAMLTDLDHRLDALAQQRARLLAHPELPPPNDLITLYPVPPSSQDFPLAAHQAAPPLAALPGPGAVDPPAAAALPVQSTLDVMRARLEEEAARRYARLQQELHAQRAVAYREKERELKARADARREEASRAFQQRIPTAKLRLTLLRERARRAKLDADAVAEQAARDRRHAQRATQLAAHAERLQADVDALAQQLADDQEALETAQATIVQEYRQALQRAEREQTAQVEDRLRAWKTEAAADIARRLAARRAELEAERDRAAAAPPPALAFPPVDTDPLPTHADRMRIAVNGTAFDATRQRLDAVRAIDNTIADLTAQRHAMRDAIAQDTRQAALSVAAQHGWTVQFDSPAGKDVTAWARSWLADYWPPRDDGTAPAR